MTYSLNNGTCSWPDRYDCVEQTSTKLKIKRKKLRLQLKNEIASLRRRIAFVTSGMASMIAGLLEEHD